MNKDIVIQYLSQRIQSLETEKAFLFAENFELKNKIAELEEFLKEKKEK